MKLAIDRLLRAQWQYQPGAPHDPDPPIDLQGSAVTADAGAFALTGQEAGVVHGYTLAATQGDFTQTGQDAGLVHGYPVGATQGDFALTGQDAALRRDRPLTVDAGEFALSGQDAALTYEPAAPSGGSGSTTSAVGGGGGPATPRVQRLEDERRAEIERRRAALRRSIEAAYDDIKGVVAAEEAAEPEAPEIIAAEIPAEAVQAIEVARQPEAKLADLREVLAVLRQVKAALEAEQDDEEALLLAA
jgi:hypothetical protein